MERVQDEPIDPFNGDPADPAAGPRRPTDDAELDPLTEAERQDVLEDLADLEIYQALLQPDRHPRAGHRVRGLPRAALLRLGPAARQPAPPADSGRPRVHEPAYDPDPDHYVTWEYARGYADGVHDTLADGTDDDDADDARRRP